MIVFAPRPSREAGWRRCALALALAAVAPLPASAQPVPARFATAEAPPPPTLRVLRDEPDAVVLEFTATWPTPLAEALSRAGTPERAVWDVAGGQTVVSEPVEVGVAVPPAVEILEADAERVPLPAGVDPEAWAAWRAPAASVGALATYRRRLTGSVDVRPVYVDGVDLVRLRRLVVRVPRARVQAALARRATLSNPHLSVTRSVLADGTWYKVPIRREGVYRITAAYLRDSLRVDAPDLSRVQVFGNGGRRLPLIAGAPRTPDLAEVPTWQTADGVYFYAEAPSWWTWRPATASRAGFWEHDTSPFSRDAFYFVRVDGTAPARLAPAAFLQDPDAVVAPVVQDRRFHEVDLHNQPRDGSGSGLDWMGEDIPRTGTPLRVLNETVPGTSAASAVRYRAAAAARSSSRTTVTFTGGGATATASLAPVSLASDFTGDLLSKGTVSFEGTAGGSLAVTVGVSGGSAAWLDWVEAVVDRAPVPGDGGALRFPTPGGVEGTVEVALEGFAAEPQVWDVTTPGAIRRLGVLADAGRWRVQIDGATAEQPREVVAFDPAGRDVRVPRRGELVPPQNLHGLTDAPTYVVVTHPTFRAEAERLAEHRRTRDGLRPVIVTADQIFNEFGGGAPDMVAVRDYVKFLYDRAATPADAPQYLLLFGDGHYDYRALRSDRPWFVPVYQTENMITRDASYTTDDFFGHLDDEEGNWEAGPAGFVDVGIGRLPVTTPREAADVVSKILRYEEPATLGAWRQRVTYVADDQYPNAWDDDIHVHNADVTAARHQAADSTITVQKIYGPSFPEVNAAGGRRRPQMTDQIVRTLNEGTLVWNYSGHGGVDGLGDEQYFTRGVLDRLDNLDRLPVFVTATCSFGRYDMSERQSLAEDTFFKPDGGAVALFTTVRVVYTNSSPGIDNNFGLNIELSRQMGARDASGRPRRLGDILLSTKRTSVGASQNNRKFNLLGDPAMRLGLAEGGVALATSPLFQAYEEATVSGTILRPDGTPDDAFAGTVEVQVYDAERVFEMPQTPPPNTPCCLTGGRYQARVDRIYTGQARVAGGRFETTFRVPQDVSYSGQPARVVAYATGASARTAAGATTQPRVAATAGTRPDDLAGPTIRLYLGDSTFVSGGLTGPTPTLVARLSDPSGINTVGAGVGHELLLTIDGDAASAIDVGRYFTGDVDSYRSGTLRVPLPALAPGPHTLTLTAWDGVNNATTAELAFVVSEREGLEIRNAWPYPNPTAGPTRFTFEHNQPAGTAARVHVRIFTLAGRPVRTLRDADTLPQGVLDAGLVQIPWDGRDEDGARLASGVYLYRLRIEVDTADGSADVIEHVDRVAVLR